MTDRQREYLAALALLGGRAPVSEPAAMLGRQRSDLSWLRDELIKEGDIYAPRHGEMTMAVPLFAGYVLRRYEQERQGTAIELLTLDHVRRNAGVPGVSADDPHERRPQRIQKEPGWRLPPPPGPPPPDTAP